MIPFTSSRIPLTIVLFSLKLSQENPITPVPGRFEIMILHNVFPIVVPKPLSKGSKT